MRLSRLAFSLLLIFACAAPAFAAAPAKPIHMLLRTVWPLRAGQKVDCQLYLWTDDGPLSLNQMKEIDGSKLQVVMMSSDYRDFYHAYPIPTGEGEFRFTIAAKHVAPLRAWTIFTTDEGKQVVIGDLNNEPITTFKPLVPPQIVQSETDSMVFTVHFPRQLRAGVPNEGMVYATLKSSKQPMKELEPVKGAYAYFAALSNDFQTLSDVYPIDPPAKDDEYGGPAIRFRLTPAREGMMRLVVQMKSRGEDMLVPFNLRVAPTVPLGHHVPDDEDPGQTPSLPPDSKLGE